MFCTEIQQKRSYITILFTSKVVADKELGLHLVILEFYVINYCTVLIVHITKAVVDFV